MNAVISEMAVTGGASAMLGAGLVGIGKLLAIKEKADQLAHARGIEEMTLVTESMNAAAGRGGTAGDWVRRFMVVALFAFMFALLPLNAIISTFVENGPEATYLYLHETPSRWWGVLPAKSEIRTASMEGIPIFRTFVEMGWLMASFYFGSSRIK